MESLTPSQGALRIAQQYLQHEFRKIFHDVKNPSIWKKLDRSIASFLKREDETSFWNLVASISEGWKLKSVYRILSDTTYEWKLQTFPLEKITLTSMSPTLNTYLLEKCERNPLLFRALWRKDPVMRKKIRATGFSAHKERDHFPILIHQAPDGTWRVFDGMRRTLVHTISGKKAVKAWVGHRVNPRGKPLISASRLWFFENISTAAVKKDQALESALIRIGQETVRMYRNAAQTLHDRIGGWSRDEKVKEMIAKIIAKK